ncbi:MAG: hypothetical protein AAF652_06850 [Cyanobacteria bacterium P01_C01_bin.72]
MLTSAKQVFKVSAIALGFIALSSAFVVNAQIRSSDSFNFEQLQTGENLNWSFSSEDETISIQDNLLELEEISISEPEDFNIRLVDENDYKPWGNTGDKEAYSFEAEVYEY